MKKVAAFNDLSGFGKCSLGVAIPILSVMGVQCCTIPTAVLTSQSGYEHHYCQDLTHFIANYTKAWAQNGESFDGLYSGYTASAEQITLFMEFVDTFYKENTLLLVDPVMGDDGHTYKMFTPELNQKMTALARRADLITPNLTEACLLADRSIEDIEKCSRASDVLELAMEVGNQLLQIADKKQEVIITGIKCCHQDESMIYNLLFSESDNFLYGSSFTGKSYSGTGDLMASILCGAKMNGLSTRDSLVLATDFITTCIADTMKEDIPCQEGVNFEKFLYQLATGRTSGRIL